MASEALTQFFLWCTVINGSTLLLWGVVFMAFPGVVFSLQSRWFPVTREQHTQAMYLFLGLFKVLFLIFNLTPLLALLIIGG